MSEQVGERLSPCPGEDQGVGVKVEVFLMKEGSCVPSVASGKAERDGWKIVKDRKIGK